MFLSCLLLHNIGCSNILQVDSLDLLKTHFVCAPRAFIRKNDLGLPDTIYSLHYIFSCVNYEHNVPRRGRASKWHEFALDDQLSTLTEYLLRVSDISSPLNEILKSSVVNVCRMIADEGYTPHRFADLPCDTSERITGISVSASVPGTPPGLDTVFSGIDLSVLLNDDSDLPPPPELSRPIPELSRPIPELSRPIPELSLGSSLDSSFSSELHILQCMLSFVPQSRDPRAQLDAFYQYVRASMSADQ